LGGRPQIETDLRALIRRMSVNAGSSAHISTQPNGTTSVRIVRLAIAAMINWAGQEMQPPKGPAGATTASA